jgi:hypothetical protein
VVKALVLEDMLPSRSKVQHFLGVNNSLESHSRNASHKGRWIYARSRSLFSHSRIFFLRERGSRLVIVIV